MLMSDIRTLAVTHVIISGKVKSVMMLLQAVSVTESATSPFANIENTLLELPPGLQATNMMPMMNNGERCMVYCVRCTSPHAIKGNKMIWPIRPTITGFGRWAINLKSCGLRVKPKSNISNVSIGSTINIAFISPNELNLQCQTGKFSHSFIYPFGKSGAKVQKKSHIRKCMQDNFAYFSLFVREDVFVHLDGKEFTVR